MGDDDVTYQFLSTDIFECYDTHLVFTGITRNSKKILKNITENLDKVKPLLYTSDLAYRSLIDRDYEEFLYLINQSWKQKKQTSSSITENEKIVLMDDTLSNNETVLAHKLCGAGNGGFFLTFSKKDTLKIPYTCVKINVEPSGVTGKIL